MCVVSAVQRVLCVQYSVCCVYCADQLRMQYSVDTLKFVLFLYIQQVYRVSLRASLVAGEEYPCQCTSYACLRATLPHDLCGCCWVFIGLSVRESVS